MLVLVELSLNKEIKLIIFMLLFMVKLLLIVKLLILVLMILIIKIVMKGGGTRHWKNWVLLLEIRLSKWIGLKKGSLVGDYRLIVLRSLGIFRIKLHSLIWNNFSKLILWELRIGVSGWNICITQLLQKDRFYCKFLYLDFWMRWLSVHNKKST